CFQKALLLVWVDHFVSVDEIPGCALELWALLKETDVNDWASVYLQRGEPATSQFIKQRKPAAKSAADSNH
ncbi:hypothetical protein STEG23_010064, partial [Scotinomys teguina]